LKEKIQRNIEKFHANVGHIDRNGIYELSNYLELNGFFCAPCSGQHHCNWAGGLLEHSLNVMDKAVALYYAFDAVKLNLQSVMFASLFHDVGKIGTYGKPYYVDNVLKDGKISAAKPYEHNKEIVECDHSVVSLHILSKFVPMTEEERQAIVYHNMLYIPSGRDVSGKEHPLTMIVHFADLWCSRVTDKGIVPMSSEVMF